MRLRGVPLALLWHGPHADENLRIVMDTTRTLMHALIEATLAGDRQALLMLKTLVSHLEAQHASNARASY